MKFIGLIGSLLIRALRATLRVRHVRPENLERVPQYILAFWHAHLLLMLHSRFRHPICVMSSISKDGDIAVNVYGWYGVEAVRGSSSKNATGVLRAFIRKARDGRNIVFTPDGPRGPARVAKDGIAFTAQATGLPVVPIAFAAKKKSSCDPGTRWSCLIHSPEPSFSMASR